MKDVYSKPISEIERFSAVDMITTSTETGNTGFLNYTAPNATEDIWAD